MSSMELDERAKGDAQFVSRSVAEALVPANSQLSLKDLFETDSQPEDEGTPSLLSWVRQRDFLLLDEQVHAIVVLKTPLVEEEILKSYLERTQISLELFATGIGPNVKPNEPRPAPVKEVLSEVFIDSKEEPFVVASRSQAQDGSDDESCLFVLWKVEIPLSRPKVKLHKLSVYLSPAITLHPPENDNDQANNDQYLLSMVPQPINLLQPFEFDPRFNGKHPYLSASRITKVAPAAPAPKDSMQRFRTAPKRLFRAGPALFWRVRFSKMTAPPKTNSIFASLELEVTPFWNCDIAIEKVDLRLAHGEVTPLGPGIPDVCKPGDQFTVLYRLTAPLPASNSLNGPAPVDDLDISISTIAKLSKICTPSVNIKWTTTADFSIDHRPRHTGAIENSRGSPEQPRAIGPDALPYSGGGNLEKPPTPTGPTGVTVTITGPERIVVGKPFRWEIFVVNRSDAVQNLAVFPISKRHKARQEGRKFPPSITPARPLNGAGQAHANGAHHDVYDMPISWFFEPSELTCLSSSARVGPLLVSACGTTELKFLAAAPGVLHVEAVRVVDLNTREATDIIDLPDIVAHVDE